MKAGDNYLHEKNLRSLYTSANQWLSEASFYDDEISFLRLLIDKYIIWLASGGNLKYALTLATRLKNIHAGMNILLSAIKGHIARLVVREKKSASSAGKLDLKRHIELENDMIGFLKSLTALKRDIFDLTERVSRSEKIKAIDKIISSRA